MKNFKSDILEACKAALYKKMELLNTELIQINESMSNETKSSAGDKHETSRARMQSEHEKLSRQLDELKTQSAVLERIDPYQSSNKIGLGNVIQTNQNWFFISIPLGKVDVDTKDVYVISSESPLGKKFLGLEISDEVKMNEVNYKIEEIY